LPNWLGPAEGFWSSLGTTLDSELSRYDAVIHLRTPTVEHAYNSRIRRIESPGKAAEIDAGIAQAWASHSRRFIVESSSDFLDKAARALQFLRATCPNAVSGTSSWRLATGGRRR